MWLLVYTTAQGAHLETLIGAINSKDYSQCNNIIYGNIINKLKNKNVRYLEIETEEELKSAKKNMGLESFPALLNIVPKDNFINHVYYENEILVEAFGFPPIK